MLFIYSLFLGQNLRNGCLQSFMIEVDAVRMS